MSSMKEMAIRDYLSKVDFRGDDWKVPKIKEDMRYFLGEEPAINVTYRKDVMVNELSGRSKEISVIEKIEVIFTDLDDKYNKVEIILGNI